MYAYIVCPSIVDLHVRIETEYRWACKHVINFCNSLQNDGILTNYLRRFRQTIGQDNGELQCWVLRISWIIYIFWNYFVFRRWYGRVVHMWVSVECCTCQYMLTLMMARLYGQYVFWVEKRVIVLLQSYCVKIMRRLYYLMYGLLCGTYETSSFLWSQIYCFNET